MNRFSIATCIAVLAAGARLVGKDAPEIRVLCSNGIGVAVRKLLPDAERAIGRKLSIEFSTSTLLKKSIDEGSPFDLAILTPGLIDNLIASGKIIAATRTTLASSDLGVGIRAGSPKVDVTLPDGMKRRLLAAKTLTWTDGGASSAAILAMFNGLGIADQLQSRIVLQKVPGRAADSVAQGENELIFAPVSEIQTVKGVELLGRLPKEFQVPVVMTAGIAANSKDATGAKALVTYLTSDKAAAAITSTGMDPVSKK